MLSAGELEASSATAAAFDLHGERGDVRVSLSLSPEVPPRVQWYEVVPAGDGEGGPTGQRVQTGALDAEGPGDGEGNRSGARP